MQLGNIVMKSQTERHKGRLELAMECLAAAEDQSGCVSCVQTESLGYAAHRCWLRMQTRSGEDFDAGVRYRAAAAGWRGGRGVRVQYVHAAARDQRTHRGGVAGDGIA